MLSPSFAAADAFPAVHEQAMRRLTEVTGLVPVEYPTTRRVGASPLARAADVNAAFADPEIRGILAVVGGRIRSPSFPTWTPNWCAATRSPFWGPGTTRICITGCRQTGLPASRAARPRFTSARVRVSTTFQA